MEIYVVERFEFGVEKVFDSYEKAREYKSKDSSHWDLSIRKMEVE
jgi:hypothetical protein